MGYKELNSGVELGKASALPAVLSLQPSSFYFYSHSLTELSQGHALGWHLEVGLRQKVKVLVLM